ncbi:MAG: 50S ribosomal protein L10 [Patescibacteria group bacterium]|nr:50S ribosomal protein L10 [Patescibacteria group bacterium]MDD5554928.1 50S ribosomal protein L10 [Patescibacteria group bacterium]
MPKSREQKKEILRDLAEKVKKAKSVVFAKFDGLGVKENENLRNKLKEEGNEYYVAKKTLLDLAFKEKGIKDLNIRNLEGKVAAIFGYEDEVAPAKITGEFKKGTPDKISFIGGILENKFISAETVETLSNLPGKQELYAKMVGSMKAPVSGFVHVLSGNLRGLVCALKAIGEKK